MLLKVKISKSLSKCLSQILQKSSFHLSRDGLSHLVKLEDFDNGEMKFLQQIAAMQKMSQMKVKSAYVYNPQTCIIVIVGTCYGTKRQSKQFLAEMIAFINALKLRHKDVKLIDFNDDCMDAQWHLKLEIAIAQQINNFNQHE